MQCEYCLEYHENETIKEGMGIKGTKIQDVEKKQLIWYEQVDYMNQGRLPRISMEGQQQEKRNIGQSKTT